jgi:hypothetical protein
MRSALQTLEPWLEQHLPNLDPVARRRFIHLVTGILEQQSLLLKAIAGGSCFRATPESNFTQVQRIIRDARLTLEDVYYPFLAHLLSLIPGDHAYLTLDQSNHADDFNLVLVGLATDAVSLPLGFLLYATDAGWAEDARALLVRLDALLPERWTITLLADRIHASAPFLSCLDELDWGYVIRLPEDTLIEQQQGEWVEVRHLRQRAGRLRVFTSVRVWKGSKRRATVCLFRHKGGDGKITTWYLITNLSGEQTRFVEYACRWWQECTHKLLKSAMFNWEGGRVVKEERVLVLLMGFGCACWALWLVGRANERVSKRKSSTQRGQKRRQNVLKRGWDVLHATRKRLASLTIPLPPAPRVLDYVRCFPGFRLPCDASLVELW